jgi:hypothetical protein
MQPFLAKPVIETFDFDIVGGLAKAAEDRLNPSLISPFGCHLTDELSAVDSSDRLRQPSCGG